MLGSRSGQRVKHMAFSLDLGTITHGIQLAVAPVFLLTAVSALIGAVTGRLARIIDRARLLEDKLRSDPLHGDVMRKELHDLRQRGWLVNISIALLTLCAICIGLTIIALFLGETTELQIYRLATYGFLTGVACFLLALLCFLAETFLATRLLRFGR